MEGHTSVDWRTIGVAVQGVKTAQSHQSPLAVLRTDQGAPKLPCGTEEIHCWCSVFTRAPWRFESLAMQMFLKGSFRLISKEHQSYALPDLCLRELFTGVNSLELLQFCAKPSLTWVYVRTLAGIKRPNYSNLPHMHQKYHSVRTCGHRRPSCFPMQFDSPPWKLFS